VKVLDFGISKVDPMKSPNEMQLTRTTEVIGSPSYMSPEQLRSARNVDTRTDIWALGVILYELLTGRVPFYAETVTELVLVVVTEREPPVRSLRADIPEGLEHIIARCLQKQPEHRFQSVLELVQALEPFAHGVQSTITERVRAVAGHSSPRPLVPMAAASSGSLPVPATSSRVNVHGGTSVAWGETQSLVGPSPLVTTAPQPNNSRMGLVAGLLGGMLLAITATGGAVYFMKRSAAHPPPAVAAGEGSMPLPPGRKDLPPIPPSAVATPAPAPAPDPPAASTLPETRKPPAPATAKASPPPRPSGGKPDDLSNIGRR
jgi:serine/threonine-protein kinase